MNNQLTKVVLVGSLGKAIGVTEWNLDVKSPSEAIRAIDINTRGAMRRYLSGPAKDRLYRIAIQKRTNVIDAKEIGHRSGRSTIYIMPTIKGRNNGIGKIIAGVVLLVVAFYTGQYELLGSYSGFAAATLTAFGSSLVLGGIAQLLTPGAQGPNASPEQAQSTSFPGNALTVSQGVPVPVVYGRALVSPLPVSVTVSNNDISTSAAGDIGGVIGTPIDGGGMQYQPE